MFHTHTESQTHTHTYCYTPIKTYKYRRRLTLFSFVWHLIHFDLFVLLENSLSAIEFARVETSDSEHTDSHTRLHCAFIACVHRRRRTETETYFWALHLSASQPTFQTSLSLLHYQDEASCVLLSLSSLGCRCSCCCYCCCCRLRVPSRRQRQYEAEADCRIAAEFAAFSLALIAAV